MNHFRTRKNIFNHSTKEMTEFLYFELIRLTVMYRIYETIEDAVGYATSTVIRPLSLPFTLHDTDLKGMLVYFDGVSNGKTEVSTKDKVLLNRTNVNTRLIYQYLQKIRHGQDISNMSRSFLDRMRVSLSIDSPRLRAMATLVNRWDNLKSKEMKLLVDKIDSYGTMFMRRSELTTKFRKLKDVSRLFNTSSEEDKKINISAGDVLMGLASGMALKWSIDSRNKNRQSFDRLRTPMKSLNHHK